MATDTIDGTGLHLESITEITADLTSGLQAIYGVDINVDSNSPDGQMIGIFAQAAADLREVALGVYNSFSVDNAVGTQLDQRVSLNGVARKPGTFTTTPVLVTVGRALTLTGLDALVANPSAIVFTVSDAQGNQYQLVATHAFGGAGSASLTFQAVTLGAVQPIANTITNQVTVVLGVTSVNNPTTSGTVEGINEETDQSLKVRRGKSFYLASTGPADAVAAQLLALGDVADAFVAENNTGSLASGVPAHGIWVIVRGGTAAEIAQAIYAKKGSGCNMAGAQTFSVSRPQGNSVTVKWDNAVSQPLYIRFGLVPNPTTYDHTVVADALAAALAYKLGQSPNIGDVVTEMLALFPKAYLDTPQVSLDNMTWLSAVSPTDFQHYFTVAAGNITIT